MCPPLPHFFLVYSTNTYLAHNICKAFFYKLFGSLRYHVQKFLDMIKGIITYHEKTNL